VNIPLGVATAMSAATFFATADFSGAVVSRRVGPLPAAFSVQLVGGALLGGLLLVEAPSIRGAALGFGLLAGLGIGIGLLALYRALAAGSMGVVAVLTGVVASIVTLVFDIGAGGHPPSLLQVTGMAIAIGGAALSARLGTVTRAIALLSIIGGCGFGASFIAFNLAAGESPIAVLFAARLSALTLLGGAWLLSEPRLFTMRPLIAVAGALDTAANGLILVAVSLMPVSLATSISSAFPPILTMFIARVVLREGLPRLAYLSVVFGCIGIGLMFVG